MSEFLGESAGASERDSKLLKLPVGAEPRKKPPEIPTRRERLSPHRKREVELARIAKDFKDGLAQLGSATEKLAQQKLVEKSTPQKLAALRQRAPSIARILERELKTVTQLAKAAPDIKHTATITRAFRERAERVIERHLPQLYASILKAEQVATQATPAKVAIPLKKGAPIEALVKAARAIRAGRLPFLPLETRKKAQALIDRVFARPRPLETRRSPDGEQRRLIERFSLIPLAVRSDIMREVNRRAPAAVQQLAAGKAVPPQLVKPRDRQLLRTVNEIIRERASKIEKETAIEQQAAPVPPTVVAGNMSRTVPPTVVAGNMPRTVPVPAFATQGAAAGGDYMAHTGEDLHVITRNDRPLVEPHERSTSPSAPAASPAAASTARARAPTRQGVPIPSAPTAAAPTPRAPAARSAQDRPGATAGKPQAAAGDTPMKIEGTLTIPGMENWVAEIEGRTKQ